MHEGPEKAKKPCRELGDCDYRTGSIHAWYTRIQISEVQMVFAYNYMFFFPLHTVCPGSTDPFHVVTYYIKWVTTSWTHSMQIVDAYYTIFSESLLNRPLQGGLESKETLPWMGGGSVIIIQDQFMIYVPTTLLGSKYTVCRYTCFIKMDQTS